MSERASAILAIGWLVWIVPFILFRLSRLFSANRGKGQPQQLDRRARWGIVVQGVGFFLVWYGPFRAIASWRIPISVAFFAVAGLLSWTSFRTLGRQWRFDAGLNADHELVRSGPYRFVRHPIYLSMIALMLGTGFLKSRLPVVGLAFVLHIIGTEIRVRIEDGLLAARFGESFEAYRHRVPAYIPFVR